MENNIVIKHTGTMAGHRKFVAEQQITKYKIAVDRFIAENGHEPTSIDFDNTDYLPSARTIQRKYGGLPQFRLMVGLKTTDFTKGATRSLKAKKSMEDCMEDETALILDLMKKYGEDDVSSPARIYARRGFTADIRFKLGNTYMLVDVFKPNSAHSFKGCVNIKNKKYFLPDEQSLYTIPVKHVFVCVNEDVMVPIKNKIPVMSLREFRDKFLK